LSLQPAGTRANTVVTTDVGESVALSVGIAGGHAVSVRAACLSVGVRALGAVGTVVEGVDVTSNISSRSSCGRAVSGSSQDSKLSSIRRGDVSVGAGNDNSETIAELPVVVGICSRYCTTPENTPEKRC
jgi:hypothetical protein